MRNVRRAFICRNKDCQTRKFLTPAEPDYVPRCNVHGPMERQTNRRYRGRLVPS